MASRRPIGVTRRVMSLREAYLLRRKLVIFDGPAADTADQITFLENRPQGLKRGNETVYHVSITDPQSRTQTVQRDGMTRVYVEDL